MPNNTMVAALQRYLGVEFVVPVGRAALGIYAALRAWSGGRALLVAVPAAVCQDVIAAVQMAGCALRLCDIDPVTGLVPEEEWRAARVSGATVAMVVHLYGNPADTALVKQIFSGADCLTIDDAAQALGARTTHGLAGAGGDVGLVSFGATKHIEVGGAALICRDERLARECERVLAQVVSTPADELRHLQASFRQRYQAARAMLVSRCNPQGFAGLLEGYEPLLRVGWQARWGREVAHRLENYPAALALRQEKAGLWARSLAGSGLVTVGMDVAAGAAPWRFACRLPGCDWARQHSLGEKMRAYGLHLSHWYLPGHWWLGDSVRALPGAQQLASEAFQFWLDEHTSRETIMNGAQIVKMVLENES